MRSLEISICAANFCYTTWLLFGNGLPTGILRWFPLVALVLTMVHFLAEGFRWQMTPVYLMVLVALLSILWFQSHSLCPSLTILGLIWIVSTSLTLASAVLGGILWPVFEFAPLTGSFKVGTISAHLVDKLRTDPYLPLRPINRELMIQVWYPAAAVDGLHRALYRDGRRSDYKDSALALVKTRSFLSAEVSKVKPTFPVLLFGGPLNRFQNTFQTEDLASHGFIVVGIDYPSDSDLVVFPDGRSTAVSKDACLLDFTSCSLLEVSRAKVERRLSVRVADTSFVLDQLQSWNDSAPGNRFYGRMDLQRVGIFGHSFGGAVAAEMCRRDPRVKAGVNMDGSLFGAVKLTGVPKPFFFMSDASPPPTRDKLDSPDGPVRREAREAEGDFRDIDLNMRSHGAAFVQVRGLQHMNLSDYSLYSRLKAWSGAGSIDPRRAHKITNRLTLVFFQRELLGDQSIKLEDVTRDYPEVTLTVPHAVAAYTTQ